MKSKFLFNRFALILVILIMAALWQQLPAATTGKIAGKIMDKDTGEPLPGVNVMVLGTKLGAATDSQGDYFILNVPPGTFSVQARMIGYTNITKTGVNVSIDRTTRVDFALTTRVLEAEGTVTVVAERPPVERDETSTRHFVRAKEIASRPTTELADILNTLPGIDGEGDELVVRRGSLDQVAFLIDGIRARNPLDFQPYQNINLSSIQELEIITGGFNAEYGEAQSGVFNIVTKEGGQTLEGFSEVRWNPPGRRHWGTEFYDYSTDRYWENSHARHLQWWIDHPDQWVDNNGLRGNDPNASWTPQQAFEYYMANHQPLTDYTDRSGYQMEVAFGGPLPISDVYFFFSGKYRSAPPVTGNAFREEGRWIDGTAKLSYHLNENIKLMVSGFYGYEETCHGMTNLVLGTGIENKYVYYDLHGLPENHTDGQIVKLTHVVNEKTFYELHFSRMYRYRSQSTFPNDPNGWEEGVPVTDNLRAVDENGDPIPEGYSNKIGLHYTGYIYRGEDHNTDYTLSGDLISQIFKNWQLKSGFDFTYYNLDRFQEAKAFSSVEDQVYNPYEGNLYTQSKLEFEGLIMNVGLRYDFYNPNDRVFLDPFDPLDLIAAEEEEREPDPDTRPTKTFGQLSPRIGISHPISENTVLHFSYGHFFQRANFGDYGEGTGGDDPSLQVSGILNTYLMDSGFGYPSPYNLGNRELKPRKTVAYELGLEKNWSGLIFDLTAFYKDITQTIRDVKIIMYNNGQYLTTGNADYADAKGIEFSIRRPLRRLWGGYLNYTWSTGISGTSGDPSVIAAPGSIAQATTVRDIGDVINYDPARLKFGLTFMTPPELKWLGGILSNWQISLDYQVYYPHTQIASDVFRGAYVLVRPANKNADIRLRKEFNFIGLRPAFFVEMRNAFNDKWINVHVPLDKKAQVEFINSNMAVFPEKASSGAPFPNMLQYINLPRQVMIGFALAF